MIFPPKVVYVCGPITAPTTAERDANIQRGKQAGIGVWRLGAVGLVPHTNSLDVFDSGVSGEQIYLGDLEILGRCDAMLRLEGWEASQGCQYETAWASHRAVPIFDGLAALGDWLDGFRKKAG